jgi:hypothetical protein
MRTIRYQLGAEELIELGSDSKVILKNRKPFLAGRIVKLGQAEENVLDTLAAVGKFMAEKLALALGTLTKIMNVSLGVIAQSVDVAVLNITDLLQKVPAIGDLLAQILLLGGALVKFGLSIPGLVLGGLGNILAGIARALGSDVQSQIDSGTQSILDQAPEELKDRVEKIIGTLGISGTNLTPDVHGNGQPMATPAGTSLSGAPPPPAPEGNGLGNALAVGVPLVALVTSLAIK